MKNETKRMIDDRFPIGEITRIKTRLGKEDLMSIKYNNLEARVEKMEDNIALILKNQASQTQLLQQILNTNTNVQALDANKQGENEGVVHETSSEKITGEGDGAASPRKKRMVKFTSHTNDSTT